MVQRKRLRKIDVNQGPKNPVNNSSNDSKRPNSVPKKKPRRLKKIKHIVPREELPKKRILKYRPQRCAFVDGDGNRCKRKAVGKSTLCKKHGGDPVIKENLIPVEHEDHFLANSKFNPAYHPLAYIEMSNRGMSEVEIAAEFRVSVNTLQSWAEKYDSFYSAQDIGKAMHEAWYLRRGKDGLDDRHFNTPLFKFMTMNKLGFSDKVESRTHNTSVHGVLLVPDEMSEEEWEKKVIDVG